MRAKKSAAAPTPPKAEYAPTKQEQTALDRLLKRHAEESPAPRIKAEKKDGAFALEIDHPDATVAIRLLADAFASSDSDFVHALLEQLANAASRGKQVADHDLNFLVAVIKDIKPRDQLETMLASHMAVVHVAIMTFARRLANVENIPQLDSAERAFNKLLRTFAMQLEALKRYRAGGEQKITVQHVTVSDGGQAIVGNVTQAARSPAAEPARGQDAPPSPALTHAAQTPMEILDAGKMRVKEPAPIRSGRKDGGRSSA
jgi:hypothetical protein